MANMNKVGLLMDKLFFHSSDFGHEGSNLVEMV